jgi:uncharacterized protein
VRSMEASEKRFVVDSMLGKLAKWLRVLGFDARSERLMSQDQIEAYIRDGLHPITRNQRWCGRGGVLCVRANDPMAQLIEAIGSLPIKAEEVRPLRRCIRCNQLLENLSRDRALRYVPEYVFETNTVFHQCPNCLRVYWPGTHSKHMMERLRRGVGWSIETNSE